MEPNRIWDIKTKEALNKMTTFYDKDHIYAKSVDEMRIYMGEQTSNNTNASSAHLPSLAPPEINPMPSDDLDRSDDERITNRIKIFRKCRVLLKKIRPDSLAKPHIIDDEEEKPEAKKICRITIKKIRVLPNQPSTTKKMQPADSRRMTRSQTKKQCT